MQLWEDEDVLNLSGGSREGKRPQGETNPCAKVVRQFGHSRVAGGMSDRWSAMLGRWGWALAGKEQLIAV